MTFFTFLLTLRDPRYSEGTIADRSKTWPKNDAYRQTGSRSRETQKVKNRVDRVCQKVFTQLQKASGVKGIC